MIALIMAITWVVNDDAALLVESSIEASRDEIGILCEELRQVRSAKAKFNRELEKPKFDEKSNVYWFKSRTQRTNAIRFVEKQIVTLRRNLWEKKIALTVPTVQYGAAKQGTPISLEVVKPFQQYADGTPNIGGPVQYIHYDFFVKVIQVLEDGKVLADMQIAGPKSEFTAMIANVPEKHLIDGARFDLPPVIYLGTQDYESRTGKRTVRTYEIADLTKISKEFEAELKKFQLDESKPRTWKTADGQHTVEASLVDLKDKTVTLKKADGSTVDIALSKLDEDSRFFAESTLGSAF